MALLDNLVLRVKAEAGQTVITDNVGSVLFNGDVGTASIFDDPTYGKLWRVTGGKKTAALSGFPNWSSVSGATYTTLVARFRVSAMVGYTRFVGYGLNYDTGLFFGGRGTGATGINAAPYSLTNPEFPCIPPYTAGTVITLVLRVKKQGGSQSANDLWVGHAGRVGTDADYTLANTAFIYERTSGLAGFDSGTETLDIIDYAVFSRGLTNAEAAAVADDVRGQLYTGSGADTTLPTQTGSIASSAITTTTYTASWPAGSDNTAVTGYEYQINSGAWIDVGNVLTANITGRSAGTTDTFNVRCYDAAGNRSTPALTTSVMLLSAGDTTLPTQTGAITASSITTTGYSLAWPAGADNVAVTGYEYRLNSGAWVDRGTNLGATITGRAAGATDAVEVRCYDAAGNRSTPPLTLNVTLSSIVTGALVIPSVRDWETNNLKLGATGVTVDVYNISTGALVKRFTGQTTHATTGDITLNDELIIASTTYSVVTRFSDGSLGIWDYTAS